MINVHEIKETKCRICIWIFLVRQESRMYHIWRSWNFGSIIVSTIFGEIKFLANLKQQTFLHIFMKRLYLKILKK